MNSGKLSLLLDAAKNGGQYRYADCPIVSTKKEKDDGSSHHPHSLLPNKFNFSPIFECSD
jgi:hypothetical protein